MMAREYAFDDIRNRSLAVNVLMMRLSSSGCFWVNNPLRSCQKYGPKAIVCGNGGLFENRVQARCLSSGVFLARRKCQTPVHHVWLPQDLPQLYPNSLARSPPYSCGNAGRDRVIFSSDIRKPPNLYIISFLFLLHVQDAILPATHIRLSCIFSN